MVSKDDSSFYVTVKTIRQSRRFFELSVFDIEKGGGTKMMQRGRVTRIPEKIIRYDALDYRRVNFGRFTRLKFVKAVSSLTRSSLTFDIFETLEIRGKIFDGKLIMALVE